MKWEHARWLANEMNIHLYALARKGCSSTLPTVLLKVLFGPTIRVNFGCQVATTDTDV